MGLDSKYIPVGSLQSYFVDKETAAALAGGKVYFYKDNARTVLKPVFQLTGNPPDYSYTELTNPLTLSSVGTFVDDDGAQIIPYYYPYDESTSVDLYYVRIYSAGGIEEGVPQFDVPAQPNVASETTDTSNIINYAPNGQFFLHSNIKYNGYDVGEIASGVGTVAVAPGGYLYIRNGTTASDSITFERIGSAVTSPTGSPRYYCRIKCDSPSPGDSYKHFNLRFSDVNRFSGTTQTFSFTAKNNSSSGTSVSVILIKNFGTGGSTETDATIKTLIIDAGVNIYNVPIEFGDNLGKTIGDADDDYLEICIALPTDYVFDISFTDIVVTPGNVVVTGFPTTTVREFQYQTLVPPLPNHDKLSEGLPFILKNGGLSYDDSQVGKMYYSALPAGYGEVLCDGTSYATSDLSSDGIPYSRLWSKFTLGHNYAQAPYLGIFGVGKGAYQMINGYWTQTPANIWALNTVAIGYQTPVADGAVPTGFTFTTVQNGAALPYIAEITNWKTGSALTAGSYFTAWIGTKEFVYWYSKDGSGTEPVVSGAKIIEIPALSSWTADDVAWATAHFINAAYIAPPDAVEMFIRVASPANYSAGRDPDAYQGIVSYQVVSGGLGYAVNDILLVPTHYGTNYAKIAVTNVNGAGAVTGSVLLYPGADMENGNISTTGGHGSGFIINVIVGAWRYSMFNSSGGGGLVSFTVQTAGSNYNSGDVVTLLGGDNNATLVYNGATWSIQNPGSRYQRDQAYSVTGGNGTGLVVVVETGLWTGFTNSIGSTQDDQLALHLHSEPRYACRGADGSALNTGWSSGDRRDHDVTQYPEATGGNENRPKNMYLNLICKI